MSVIALYVQKGETLYRQYFQDNLPELQRGFLRYQYNLLYLPSITRSDSPSFNEGLRQYLEIYYPSFKRLSVIQQQQAVYRQLDEMFHLNLRDGAYIFYIKPGHFDFEELPSDIEPKQALAKYLDSSSETFKANYSRANLTPRDTSVLLKNLSVEERRHWDDFLPDLMANVDALPAETDNFEQLAVDNKGGNLSAIEEEIKTIVRYYSWQSIRNSCGIQYQQSGIVGNGFC